MKKECPEVKVMDIEGFITSLTRKGSLNPAADNTKVAYASTLGKFRTFLGGREPNSEFAQEFIQKEMQRGLTAASVSRYGRAIKRYLEWYGKDVSRILLPSPKRKLPDYHDKRELERLLKAARTPLERALLIVLTDTGLRISEFLALEKKDIDREGGFIFAHREKTGVEGWIPISAKSIAAIDEYIKWAMPKGSKLFPYTYHQIRNWLKQLGEKVGVKVRPHKMRHTAAALRRIEGQRIETLADLLGHKRLETTRIYESIKPKELKEELKEIW